MGQGWSLEVGGVGMGVWLGREVVWVRVGGWRWVGAGGEGKNKQISGDLTRKRSEPSPLALSGAGAQWSRSTAEVERSIQIR